MTKEKNYNISNIDLDAYYKESELPISESLKKMLDEASLEANNPKIKKLTLKEILLNFNFKNV